MCRPPSEAHDQSMFTTTPELMQQLHTDRAARLAPDRTVRQRAHLHLPGLPVWLVVRPRRAAASRPDLQPCP
jgi:hypothetical protein